MAQPLLACHSVPDARGLTTSLIPYCERAFQIDFDFIDHLLRIETSDGQQWQMPLRAQSVADFHAAVMAALAELGMPVAINELANEVPEPIRLNEDRRHAAYDAEYAYQFWRVLFQVDRVFKIFRSGFYRQVQSRAFFPGQFRLGSDPLFWPPRAAASGPRSEPCGRGRVRGLFA